MFYQIGLLFKYFEDVSLNTRWVIATFAKTIQFPENMDTYTRQSGRKLCTNN